MIGLECHLWDFHRSQALQDAGRILLVKSSTGAADVSELAVAIAAQHEAGEARTIHFPAPDHGLAARGGLTVLDRPLHRWMICRSAAPGRSLQDLVAFLGEIQAAGIALFLHQESLDTNTASGAGHVPDAGYLR